MSLTGRALAILLAVLSALVVEGSVTDSPIAPADPSADRGQAPTSLVWIVVGILAAIALVIFIAGHVQTKP